MAKASCYFSSLPSPFVSSIGRPNMLPAHINVPRCCSQQPSSSPLATTLAEIQNSGVIACLRAKSAELAMEAAHAALRGGISVLEIVMSTPGVFEVLQELVRGHPTSIIGVGTVLNTIDAKNAIKAGAKFLMSPAMVKDILDDVQSKEVLYIPGVMTPTEVLNAHSAGAIIVKGITVESLGTYIARGASAVVLSDAIFGKEAMDQQNFDAIRQLSQLAVSRGDEAVQRPRLRRFSVESRAEKACWF